MAAHQRPRYRPPLARNPPPGTYLRQPTSLALCARVRPPSLPATSLPPASPVAVGERGGSCTYLWAR
jgi:hypothetical protein